MIKLVKLSPEALLKTKPKKSILKTPKYTHTEASKAYAKTAKPSAEQLRAYNVRFDKTQPKPQKTLTDSEVRMLEPIEQIKLLTARPDLDQNNLVKLYKARPKEVLNVLKLRKQQYDKEVALAEAVSTMKSILANDKKLAKHYYKQLNKKSFTNSPLPVRHKNIK